MRPLADVPRLLGGKVVVVTGGGSGLGRAAACATARSGASAVIVADLRDEPREGGQPTADWIRSHTDARGVFVRADVTDRESLRSAIDAAEAHGGVDVMVNCAGVCRPEEFTSVTEEEFIVTMDTNVKGTYFGSQLAAKAMIPRQSGSIINLSSIAGLNGAAGYVTYCASKGAVRSLTYALAAEVGPFGIRANVVHPGVVDTELTRVDTKFVDPDDPAAADRAGVPLQRWGRPEDVAAAVIYLASEMASHVTGTSLVVDGGMSRGI